MPTHKTYLKHSVTGEISVAGFPAAYKFAKNLYRKKVSFENIARALTIAVMQSKKAHEEDAQETRLPSSYKVTKEAEDDKSSSL